MPFLTTTHPKNGHNVTVEFNEDLRVVNATYDDGEEIEMTPAIQEHLQADVNTYARN